MQGQIELNRTQLTATQTSITESNTVLETLEAALLEFLRTKESEERLLNLADQEYHNLRNQLSERESELRSRSKEKDSVEQLLSEIRERLSELKLSLAGMKERLQVEFRINLDRKSTRLNSSH